MVRIAQVKENSEANLATNKNKNGKLRTAAILKVNMDGVIEKLANTPQAAFELNPSSYEETKTSNWASQNVPGQSDPVYQWVSGGPRTITFEALVTKDTIHGGQANSSVAQTLVNNALVMAGNIAASFAGILPLPDNISLTSSETPEVPLLSIADKLAYYRSLMYPTYTASYSEIESHPPLVVLVTGKTFSSEIVNPGSKISPPGGPKGDYLPVWMVMSITNRITKQLPNLEPMEAMVTFTLQEYAIKPISRENFPFLATSGETGEE